MSIKYLFASLVGEILGAMRWALFVMRNQQWVQVDAPVDALILYADGVHNDAAALCAWLKGEPVRWPSGKTVSSWLDGHTFRVDEAWRPKLNEIDGSRRMGSDIFIGKHGSDWLA